MYNIVFLLLGLKIKGGQLFVTFAFCIDYIEQNGQFMLQEVFPFVFLAPRVLNWSCRHYYPSENI